MVISGPVKRLLSSSLALVACFKLATCALATCWVVAGAGVVVVVGAGFAVVVVVVEVVVVEEVVVVGSAVVDVGR